MEFEIDCGLDSRSVFELNVGILSSAFPRLRELEVEGESETGVSFRVGPVFVSQRFLFEFAAKTRRIHRREAFFRGFSLI